MLESTTKLYDLDKTKSIAKSYFLSKIDKDKFKIDSLRGICTPLALQRLAKIAKIKKFGNCYKLGSTGICLKARKINNKAGFNVEFFAIYQYYNLSQTAQKQHREVLKYLLTRKSFHFSEVDMCLDTTRSLDTRHTSSIKAYKGTIYRHYDEAKLCIYQKALKDEKRGLSKSLKRYELTLKLAKNTPKAKPTKPRTHRKQSTYKPLNRNILNNINYILENKKYKILKNYKNFREFVRKLNSS